jgi:hypothetical protein
MIVLENLIVAQLVKKFLHFSGSVVITLEMKSITRYGVTRVYSPTVC